MAIWRTRALLLGCTAGLVLGLAPRSAAESGAVVSIVSTPVGAAVDLDGVSAGVTPLELPVPAGHHHLILTLEGFVPVERDLELRDGERRTLEVVIRSEAVAAPGAQPAPAAATDLKAAEATKTSFFPDIPVPTWIAGGAAAVLFGVGLGFGATANDIDHKAGITVSQSGVDLGLTRAQAVAGQTDANVANVLLVSAGVAVVVGLVFAVLAPAPASVAPAELPKAVPAPSPDPASGVTP